MCNGIDDGDRIDVVANVDDEIGGNVDVDITRNDENVIGKADVMFLNNGWNDKNERIVISVGENAASYKWMHEKSAHVYKIVNNMLSIILIVFTSALSAETFFQSDTILALEIMKRILTYVVTVISVVQNFLKYEQLAERHYRVSVDFSKLYHDIQQQMCMYRRDRKLATSYVSDILRRYDTLVLNGPSINTRVLSQFKTKFQNSDIAIPDIADRIQKIEIITEPVQPMSYMNQQTNGLAEPQAQSSSTTVCNLQNIYHAFQIHGDITDNDIQNADSTQLKELRSRFLREKSNFETQRFHQH